MRKLILALLVILFMAMTVLPCHSWQIKTGDSLHGVTFDRTVKRLIDIARGVEIGQECVAKTFNYSEKYYSGNGGPLISVSEFSDRCIEKLLSSEVGK